VAFIACVHALLEALHRAKDILAQQQHLATELGSLDAALAQHRHRSSHRLGELAQHAGHRGLREG
jgi:conjugal transfer/entry exclusion protein